MLLEKAWQRWNLKCGFARKRIDRLGWDEACHTTPMEILGFSENRIPMLRVATAVSLVELREAPPDLESLYGIGGGMWTIRGTRRANYPGLRLVQYLHSVAENPSWLRALERWASSRPVDGILTSEATGVLRKAIEMPGLKREIGARVCSDCVGGSKLDTLVCDGFLPLLSARKAISFRKLWFHWYAGNAPKEASSSLRKLGVIEPKTFPLANSWVHGLFNLRHPQTGGALQLA